MNLRHMALAATICFGAVFLTGCFEDHYKNKAEKERIEKLSELRTRISSSFLLGAVGYVCIGLLGPSLAEASRKTVADQLKLTIADQISLAKGLYWTVIVSVFLMSLFSAHLSNVKPAVWLLLGATAYPFFVHVIPSLEAGDKMRRKAAFAQIKSFLMLVFIFYVILRFLSPDGFGNIQLR